MNDRSFPSLAAWSAIAMALLVGVVVQFMLGLFGLSLELSALAPTSDQPASNTTITWAALLWWFLSSSLSLFIAGLVVGWLRQTQGAVDAVIYGSTVWALSTILAVWFATTLIGATLGGAFTLLTTPSGQTRAPVEVVVRLPDSIANGSEISRPRHVTPPASKESQFATVIKSMTWFVLLQAAEQLKDPEVRATIRRMMVGAFHDLEVFRAPAAKELRQWLDKLDRREEVSDGSLQQWLESALLMDPETARAVVDGWKLRLEAASQLPDQPDDAQIRQEALDLPMQSREALISRAVETLESLYLELSQLLSSGGTLGPEKRREIVSQLRRVLAVTEVRAERLVDGWERRARSAFVELSRIRDQANKHARETAKTGLEHTASAAGWAGFALLFGWIATIVGAFAAARASL